MRSLDLKINADSVVLDAGSGTGIVSLAFHDAGFLPQRSIAVDLSFKSLKSRAKSLAGIKNTPPQLMLCRVMS